MDKIYPVYRFFTADNPDPDLPFYHQSGSVPAAGIIISIIPPDLKKDSPSWEQGGPEFS